MAFHHDRDPALGFLLILHTASCPLGYPACHCCLLFQTVKTFKERLDQPVRRYT
jgi:hypothetical protein